MTSAAERPQPIALEGPALLDTGVWTWVRDRRYPALAEWFNSAAANGRVLICDLVALELGRLAANRDRAERLTSRLAAFESLPMPEQLWARA